MLNKMLEDLIIFADEQTTISYIGSLFIISGLAGLTYTLNRIGVNKINKYKIEMPYASDYFIGENI